MMAAMEPGAKPQAREVTGHPEWVTVLRRIGSGVSHDLNNSLSVVTTHCELLLQTLDPRSEMARDIDGMRRAATTGAKTLRNFDLLANLRPTPWDGVDLEVVLRRLELPLAYVAGAGARLSLDIHQRGRTAWGETADVERLILTAAALVRNAMREDGEVHLMVRAAAESVGVRPSVTIEIRGEPRSGTPGDAGRAPLLEAHGSARIASAYLRSLTEDLGGTLDEGRAPAGQLRLRIELPLDPSTTT